MGAEALCRIEQCREENNYLTTNKMASNKEIGEQYGIHPRDVEKIKFAFEVYDFKGHGKVDGFYIGDLVRACNLNPTMKTIVEIGGEKEKQEDHRPRGYVSPLQKGQGLQGYRWHPRFRCDLEVVRQKFRQDHALQGSLQAVDQLG